MSRQVFQASLAWLERTGEYWLGVRAKLGDPTCIQELVGFDFDQCQRRENLGFLSLHRCREKKKGGSLKLPEN